MEWIQHLLDNSSIPLFTAFLLGLVTAISPCPLATNITAIGYISKDIENKHRVFINGLLYTLGRVITYVGIAFIIIPLLKEGASIYAIQKAISSYGGLIISPILILIGLFMLFKNKIKLPQFGFRGNTEKVNRKNWWGTILLGMLFALAFCPTSGVFYFVVLMPLSAAEAEGYLLPVIFAISTGVPVIIVAWILAYSVAGLGKFYKRMQTFQKWMNIIIACIFIIIGIYYTTIFYF